MVEQVPRCLTPAEAEAIAAGEPAEAWAEAHAARCRTCADAIEDARFALRFGRVLNEPADGAGVSLQIEQTPGNTPAIPRILGYTVLREHARGGQGVVYRARQDATGQIVAIKVLHPWSGATAGSASGDARARFQREIRISGSLRHPGIVRLIDSIVLPDGRDAIVMEWIEGVPLDDWADANPELRKGTMTRLLGVLAEVVEAVAYAHQRGVIHRDLKPSNILIDEHGRVRVLDFGVARMHDTPGTQELLTRTGEFTGTLAFAAPEQVAGVRADPDTRTDLYALGVIAYRVLTGRLPYDVSCSLQSAIQNIATADPASRDASMIPGDARTVVLKAMAKDLRRRYQSAGEMAADLRRASSGEAVAARADSRIYILRKAARRHRVALALAGSVMLGLIAVAGVMVVGNVRLSAALRESRLQELRAHTAVGARDRAERVLWDQVAGTPMGSDAFDPVEGLWHAGLRERELLWAFVEMQARATCTDILPAPEGRVVALHPADDGRFVLLTETGRLTWLAVDAGRAELTRGPVLTPTPRSVAFSPSGRHALVRDAEHIRWIRTETGETLAQRPVGDLPFPPVAERLTDWGAVVLAQDGDALVLTLPELRDRRLIPGVAAQMRPWLDPDDPALFTIDAGARLVRIDIDTGWSEPWSPGPIVPEGLPPEHAKVHASRDRRVFAVTHADGIHTIFRSDTGQTQHRSIRQSTRIGATLSADGRTLAGQAFGDSTLRLWSLPEGRELPALTGHRAVYLHAIGADGKHILTADSEGVLRLWLSPGDGWRRTLGDSTARTHEFATSNDGRELLASDDDGRLVVYTPGHPHATRRIAVDHPMEIVRVAVCPRTGLMAAAGIDDRVLILRPSERAGELEPEIVSLGPGQRVTGLAFISGADAGLALLACTHAGLWVSIRLNDAVVTHRSIATGEQARASDLRVADDGRLGAVAFRDGRVALIDPGTLEVRRWIEISPSQIRSISFSPDGRTLAAVGDDGRLHCVDTRTARVRSSDPLGEHSLFSVDVHPTGKSVAVGDILGRVTVFDLVSGRPVATLTAGGAVMCLRFTPDGRSLDVAALHSPVERWDLSALASTFHRLRPNPARDATPSSLKARSSPE